MKIHYNKNDILYALQEVGLARGDDVFIHSNLGYFGNCEGVNNSDELCDAFLSAFFYVIGDEGTVIVPTFTYSACHGEPFNKDTTLCKMGMFSDYVIKQKPSHRSDDPNFSVSAIGKRAAYYTQNSPAHSFGCNSFFERFYLQGGKICCLNFDAGTTFVHYVEKALSVPYRYDKSFTTDVFVEGHWEKREAIHFVYSYDHPEDEAVFERLHQICIDSGIAKMMKLGKGTVLCESSQDLFALIERTIKVRPRFLLKEE